MVKPRFELLAEKKLIGKRLKMSLANNKTGELFRSFMPHRHEIQNKIGSEVYSIQVFEPGYFETFNPNAEFEKWAAVEVLGFEITHSEMESITLFGGLYAVFHYKGLSTDTKIFEYIFSQWLPNSDYVLDHRPHFEILGEFYKNNDPTSEEDIWVPLKIKPLII